ncbi:MAG TPA: Ig-like domain-containing protein [Myxococcales bacterium]|jgi:hypothetical protein
MKLNTLGFYSRVIAFLSAALVAVPAHATLTRVGPADPSPQIGGYPAWYQDSTGLALEFCDPLNASELQSAWCVILPPIGPLPESYPTNFNVEHFYFSATATATASNGSKASLIMALEAAQTFQGSPNRVGPFARIRIKLPLVPVTGTYTIYHPYGVDKIDAVAGDRIFFTDDVGLSCADFNCALTSRLGPFLVPSQTPGGAEIPPVTATNQTPDTNPANFAGAFVQTPYPGTGKAYLADPNRIGPVTGSSLPNFIDSTGVSQNHNTFRMEGPPGSNIGGPGQDWIQTSNFQLGGRIDTSTLPASVNIDRSSYSRSASALSVQVFASGTEASSPRVPGQPAAAANPPSLSFFSSPCGTDAAGNFIAPAAGTATQMTSSTAFAGTGITDFWAKTSPATLPTAVCVEDAAARDATGAIVPSFRQSTVVDDVVVSSATYDSGSLTLAASATSSDTLVAPVLSLVNYGPLTGGSISVPSISAPPSKVRVSSSAGGFTDLNVVTTTTAAPPAPTLVAVNDSFAVAQDSGPNPLTVLANDTGAAAGVTITITSPPRLGTAAAGAGGTVVYTPAAGVNGQDSFAYSFTNGTTTSNVASVAIAIVAASPAPTAVNDSFTVNVGVAATLPSVLANDTDPQGNADIANAINLTSPGANATATGGAGGIITFTATVPGSYTFTYQAQDAEGNVSANAATVTVTAVSADAPVIAKAQFTNAQKRWVVSGTDSAFAEGTIVHITYNNGAPAGFEIGTAQVAGGNWLMDLRGVTGTSDPTTFPVATRPTQVRATSDLGGTFVFGPINEK